MQQEIGINFKTEREAREFALLNPKLQIILLDATCYTATNYHHTLTITHLIRTQKEQDEIYLNHPVKSIREKYKKKPWPSEHEVKNGGDVRTDLPASWLKELCDYINEKYIYDPKRPELQIVFGHNVGRGEHLHFKVWEG